MREPRAVGWMKYFDGRIAFEKYSAFIPDDALSLGWRKLYTDDALQAAAVEAQNQQARIAELEDSVRFFAIRCEELQEIQSRMRDPERQMVCDILANGKPRDKAGIGEYKALLGGGRDI